MRENGAFFDEKARFDSFSVMSDKAKSLIIKQF